MKDFIIYYLRNEQNFNRYLPKLMNADTPTVFLIHGWGVSALSMSKLSKALVDEGYIVYNYDYPTSKKSIEDHARTFVELFKTTVQQDHIEGSISFVTHSMGGLVLRSALAIMSEEECKKIDSIVMLGPPNRGSKLAKIGLSKFFRKHNKSLGDMYISEDSYVNHIPEPSYLPPVGIIAGKYDFKVSLNNTSLPEGQRFERILVDCCHPGLRQPKHTLKPIIQFLKHKTFRRS